MPFKKIWVQKGQRRTRGKDQSHGLMPGLGTSSFQSGGSQLRVWSLKIREEMALTVHFSGLPKVVFFTSDFSTLTRTIWESSSPNSKFNIYWLKTISGARKRAFRIQATFRHELYLNMWDRKRAKWGIHVAREFRSCTRSGVPNLFKELL